MTGCDLGLFEGCEWYSPTPPDRALAKDVRDVTEWDLEDHDCVVHLAAISNDPMGELDPGLTERINADATIQLARVARSAGVPRFLFASSCSIYGQGESLDLDESAALNPISAYAKSKIDAEAALSELAGADFTTASLRNATAYGASPMLRVDLVANNLLAWAVVNGDIRVMSDGSPWRPLIHCRDIARAFAAFADAPRDRIHNRSINVGGNDENYQVREVAEVVRSLVPGTTVVYTGEVGHDPRNYRVNFDLLGQVVPEFQPEFTLASGVEDLYGRFLEHRFTLADFEGNRYVRLRRLRERLSLLNPHGAVA